MHTLLLQSHSETIQECSLLAQYTSVDEFSSTRFPMCLIFTLDCKSDQALLKELPYILPQQAQGQTQTYMHA